MKDKRVDSVVCATDAGREGELISVWSMNMPDVISLWNAFGFPVWRMRRSVRVLTISVPAVIDDNSMMRQYAGQEPTG